MTPSNQWLLNVPWELAGALDEGGRSPRARRTLRLSEGATEGKPATCRSVWAGVASTPATFWMIATPAFYKFENIRG